MGRQVTLNAGLKNVVLPNGIRYQGSQSTVLSDAEYSLLSASAKSSLFSSDVSTSATISELAPSDHGLIAWNFPPYNIRSSDLHALTAGTLLVAKLRVPSAQTIAKVGYYVQQAGTSLTAGQNFAALFSATGTLLSATADQTAGFGAAGTYLVSLATPQAVSAGYVYVGWYFNGAGTALGLGIGDATSSVLNFNLAGNAFLWATANTGLTTAMPASLGTLTSVTDGAWACVA